MAKALIIGAGGVATVAAQTMATDAETFSDIVIASRRLHKAQQLADKAKAKANGKINISADQVDADCPEQLDRLLQQHRPDIVVHLALPYQDLTIMQACLRNHCHYLDTANYESRERAHFEYAQQWAMHDDFVKAGLTAILGCGFDPGVTGVYTAYAAKHIFDEITELDITDCNAGDHHQAFATNFNPEINIREITQPGRYYHDGQWIATGPLEQHKPIEYPAIGPRESYLMYHEELESITKHFPTIRTARFWMTFSQMYLDTLHALERTGMTSIKPIDIEAPLADDPEKNVIVRIAPLQLLKAVLPKPEALGENYEGQTSIGCRMTGTKDGKTIRCHIYNNCQHQDAYKITGTQAIDFTTGVPAATGTAMLLKGLWLKPGVYNTEEFDPDPFLELLDHNQLHTCVESEE